MGPHLAQETRCGGVGERLTDVRSDLGEVFLGGVQADSMISSSRAAVEANGAITTSVWPGRDRLGRSAGDPEDVGDYRGDLDLGIFQ
jgi:hypothetical protein